MMASLARRQDACDRRQLAASVDENGVLGGRERLDMKIAINGIGVAGPALAYWLLRHSHEPVLFEKAPAIRTGGYLVDFWGIGYDVADKMGIVPALREKAYLMERLQMVDERGQTVAKMNVDPIRDKLGGRFISIARSDISATILRACRDVDARFGVSIHEIRDDGSGVSVKLSDGSAGRFDLVIGAAACVSLLAGEGTGLAMTEAYVLADELHRAERDYARAFEGYERRLHPFLAKKQAGALRLLGFFAPRTKVGLKVRDWLVNATSLPLVNQLTLGPWLQDDFVLDPSERSC
jgi:2-polyprenyl-6-methoxyphenol hydroxylase-like FAD-dependent oxidoreductase